MKTAGGGGEWDINADALVDMDITRFRLDDIEAESIE
jgi:hypothetical protein